MTEKELVQKLLEKYHITPNQLNTNPVGTYLELERARSRLDGLFESDELRRIADAMDELSSQTGDRS